MVMSNMNRSVWIGVFSLAAGLAAGPAASDTLEVPGQYATIQEAIDAATKGDTILVDDGTYDPPADILIEGKWNLSLIGADWFDRQVVNASFRLIDSEGILLERFTIHGAVTISCNEGTVLRDCEISSSGGAGIAVTSCPGGAYSEVHVTGCRIVENTGAGIEAELSGGQASFSGNSIHGNGGRGISILHSYGSVSGNTIYGNGSDGVRIEDASFAVTANTIAYNSSGGIRIISGIGPLTQQIHHNAIASNAGVGISSSYGSNVEIQCNDVWGNGPSSQENYGGSLADRTGILGNISLDPLFCDPLAGDIRPADNSPLLLQACGTMGAYQSAGCEAIGTRDRTWGGIKSLYR
jgi:parallel beta-helix repeat protein